MDCLLFGKQVAPKTSRQDNKSDIQSPFMRREQASAFVLNLSQNRRPYSIGAWASRMSYQIKTPHFNNVNKLKKSHVMIATRISSVVSDVKSQYGSLETNQQVKKIRALCEEGGIVLPGIVHDDRVNQLFRNALSSNEDKQMLICKKILYRPRLRGEELKGTSPHQTETPVNSVDSNTVNRRNPNR